VAGHVALGALAGLGAAALLARVRGRGTWALGALLVLGSAITVLRPLLPGEPPRIAFAAVSLAPSTEEIDLFRRLEAAGSRGPIFDAPMLQGALGGSSQAVLLSAYHRRRTSACSASFRQPELALLQRLAAELPRPEAVRQLAELGFETLVLRHRSEQGGEIRSRYVRESRGSLLEIGATANLSAWAITAPGDARGPPTQAR
jgi:hypothetical protein